jgi:hypothetical protein
MADDLDSQDRQEIKSPEEIEKLKAENIALKEQLEKKKGERKSRGGSFRNFMVWFMVILACFFAITGVLATWVRATTLDTNTFVKTVAPLIQKDAVANAVSEEAVKVLFEKVDITGSIQQVLPAKLQFMAKPLASGVQTMAREAAKKILKSSQFQWAWQKILRLAHGSAIKIIKGEGGVSVTSQGKVVLDIGNLLTEIKDRLVAEGLDVLKNVPIPASAGQVELFSSEKLGALKSVVDLLDTLNWVLPLLSFIFFLLAVVIAKDRRKTLLGAGVGLAIAMAVLLILLSLTKAELLGQIKNKSYHEAGLVIWSSVFSGLRQTDVGLLVLGVLVALGAAVVGPYDWAVSLRSKIGGLFENWRERRKSGDKSKGPVGSFITAHAWALRIAGAVVAIIVLLALPHLSAVALIVTAAIYLVYLVAIELLR